MKIRIAVTLMAAILLLTAALPVGVLAVYENTYKNTGDQRADIIGVASTQVGYIEEAGGYTKYGQWFGRPYEDWCGIFISWCAEQAGVPNSVLRRNGLASPSGFGFSEYYSSDNYTPKPGDLFFTKSFSHAGLVYYVDGDSFYTLEGNTWHNGSPHGVMTKIRALDEHYFVSPNYNGSGESITPPTEPTKPQCSHSWKDDSVIKDATCTDDGSKSQVCEKCDEKRTVSIPVKDHSFEDWTQKDEEKHQRTCESCKKIETQAHEETDWLSDSAGHWKECQTCKGQLEIQPHSYAGGCGTQCTVCEYLNQDGHNYGSWQTDDTQHWQLCTACDKETEHQAHNYPAECAENCTDCGHRRETEHTYEYKADAYGHWQYCTGCGKKESKQVHISGPEASEENAQLCIDCGYELAPKLDHMHSYTYSFDRLTHWGQCACGSVAEAESHRWSIEYNRCSVCGTAALQTEEKKDWDMVWIATAGVAFTSTMLCVVLLICKKKKNS